MASDLKKKTISGFTWASIESFTNHGVEFLLMLFMARLLSPKEYGLIGLTAVFLAISAIFIDSGFPKALIRKKNVTKDDLSTVFIFNLIISFFFFIIVYLSAPYVAIFYNEPILCPVLRVLDIKLILLALCSVQKTLLKKNINFKKIAKISVFNNITSGVLGVIFAYFGYGVWALVIQSMSASLLLTILLWTTTQWHPSLRFSKKSFKELFGYGSNILITQLINSLYGQIYPIVIGKYFSAATLGNFSRARHWANLPSKNLNGILQNVTFPVLAKIQDDDKRLENIYRRMIRTSVFIIFPLMIGLSAVAKPLTFVAIGEKWDFSATLLQIICFAMMWYPVHALNLNLLQVKGRSDLFLKLEIIKKIIGICVLCISIPMGIVAMCYFRVLTSLIALFINTYYTGKLIQVGFIKQMYDIAPTLLLAMIMWGVILLTIQFISNIYLQLIVGILIGAAIYLAGSYLFKFPELKEVLVMYKDLKNRKK